jgi:hypothetical protein
MWWWATQAPLRHQVGCTPVGLQLGSDHVHTKRNTRRQQRVQRREEFLQWDRLDCHIESELGEHADGERAKEPPSALLSLFLHGAEACGTFLPGGDTSHLLRLFHLPTLLPGHR